jgi:nicotinic acid mononucleotide adenylyltransferase
MIMDVKMLQLSPVVGPFEALRDLGDKAPRLYVISTGAGAGIQDRIWSVPGISNFFVGASMPYDTEATDELLGFKPTKYVSIDTAIDLAHAAYMRAWKPGRDAIGFGMTCSVASTKEHRGDHSIIAALFDEIGCWVIYGNIPKGAGSGQRISDGNLANDLAIAVMDQYVNVGLDTSVSPNGLEVDGCTFSVVRVDTLSRVRIMAHPFFRANGTRASFEEMTDELEPTKTIFFPGAFNPPHKAHHEAARAAQEVLLKREGLRRLVFSTTIDPKHKSALIDAEMLQRAKQMKGFDYLLTEGDPLFIIKARRFPGAHFIMGADTMERLLDPKWGQEIKSMLDEFKWLQTHFLVPGRVINGKYTTCKDVLETQLRSSIEYWSLFTDVQFRMDLSSTELRSAQK